MTHTPRSDETRIRALIVGINYLPEQTGFAPHLSYLAESLASHGHVVTVLTGFPFAPLWKRWSEYRGRLFSREIVNGVEVIRSTHFIPRRPGAMAQRILMEGSFVLMALLSLSKSQQAPWNVVVYCGAQPSLAMLAKGLAAWCGVPYVVSIQDLAAQAATDVGIVKHRLLSTLLERFEYAAYRGAARAFVLCQAFSDALVAHRYPVEAVHLLRSPIDVELVRPVPPTPRFRAQHNLSPDNFVVLYSGSMGLKQGLENVIAAAHGLRQTAPDVRWVLVGDGEVKPILERRIAEQQLQDCVKLLPLQPAEEMAEMFASADVLLLNQVATVKATVIPSKLLTYMAAGRPVLAAVHPLSQGAVLLVEADGGLVVAPDDPRALGEGVMRLRGADAPSRAGMAQRNRAFAEAHFDKKRIVARQEDVLREVVFGSN
jgi:colanic acid biosynthesis glycosyl transferase WcaI